MELAILIGLPASGKTTFFRQRLAATHVQVSKDLLRRGRQRSGRERERIGEALRAGRSVAVDNTNPTATERGRLIELGRAHGARIVGYFFDVERREALVRNRRREGAERVPDVAIHAAAKRLEPPSVTEGFDELYAVRIGGEGEFQITRLAGPEATRLRSEP
jgi:predicted kinase